MAAPQEQEEEDLKGLKFVMTPLLAGPVADDLRDATDEKYLELNDRPVPKSAALHRKFLRQASSFANYELPNYVDDPNDSEQQSRRFPLVCRTIQIFCLGMMILATGVNGWDMEPLSENPTFGPSVGTLLTIGAKRTDLIVEGDYYRLFTPISLHGGWVHYALNMLGIELIGVPLERQFGVFAVGYIFLISGFMGVVVGAIFAPSTVGVGASGGVFGFFGAAWADLIQNWSLYSPSAWTTVRQLFFATVLNLMFGLLPFLDNYAHIGGFFSGIVCGLGVLVANRYTRSGQRKSKKTYQGCLQLLSIILTPFMIVVGLFVLFNVVGKGNLASEWCPWCGYLTCVSFPPGDNPWWTCDPCSTAGASATSDGFGNTTITCPDGIPPCSISTPTDLSPETFLGYCREYCLEECPKL